VDHILTLKAGGLNVIENFQSLCETCNKRKQRDDKAAAAAYKRVP
jgi:5-methylcytosine-specific restriction endonuclease McrA